MGGKQNSYFFHERNSYMIHTVSPGETLYSIAADYGISPIGLANANALSPTSPLAVGQTLLLLYPRTQYTVQPGDTLFAIAAANGITEKELLRRNPDLPLPLQVGEVLTISYEGEGTAPLFLGGYAYPFIEPSLLTAVLPNLSEITLFTYGFRRDGTLIPPPFSDFSQTAADFGIGVQMELATLTEEGRFDSSLASALFASEEVQGRLIGEILETIRREGYRGIELDFEYIPPEDTAGFIGFTRRLREVLSPYGYTVSVCLAPKTRDDQPGLLYEAHDYASLGDAADRVFLMTYEWGYKYGPPMAVAPLDRVRAVLNYALTRIPAEKILLGIANYGYDWTLPFDKNRPADTISQPEALALALRYGAAIEFDPVAASPHFDYTDENGEAHSVWFEDLRSIRAKLDLINEAGLLGGGIWTVMRPYPPLYLLAATSFFIR